MKIKLTKEQRVILQHTLGVGLITAGAGCGKTTALLEYIVHCVINLGLDASEILVLSFSKAAGDEFRERLNRYRFGHGGALLNLDKVKVMTYEAFGYQIIRDNHQTLGFEEIPTVIGNTKHIRKYVAKIAERQGANRKELMKDVIAKCQGLALETPNPLVDKVLRVYQKRKKNNNLVDFQDMVAMLVEAKQHLLVKAANRYRCLLVDELQDTNLVQAKMLITLTKVISTVLMVGDPKQNIYEFRGAYVHNWTYIKSELKPKEYRLSESHRVPRSSLPYINKIGEEIHPGTKLTSKMKGQRVCLVHCESTVDQARFIADTIKFLINTEGVSPNQIACLGRTRRLLSDLSIELENHGIVHQECYRDPTTIHTVGFRNMLRHARLFRAQPLEDMAEFPPDRRPALTRALKRLGATPDEIDMIFKKLPRRGWKAMGVGSPNSKAKGKANPNYRRILEFRKLFSLAMDTEELEKAVAYFIDAMRKVLGKKYRRRDLDFLMKDLIQFKIKVRKFAGWHDLRIDKLQLEDTEGGVQLSTINGAKGKEWHYVFVIHCVDGILPSHYAKTDEQILAEKRLLYVASTRHKKGLYLMNTPGSIVVYDGSRKDKAFTECSSFITSHTKHLRELDGA